MGFFSNLFKKNVSLVEQIEEGDRFTIISEIDRTSKNYRVVSEVNHEKGYTIIISVEEG